MPPQRETRNMETPRQTDLARVPVRRLIAELERRAQSSDDFSTDQVLNLIVIAAVVAVLAEVGDQLERGTLQ